MFIGPTQDDVIQGASGVYSATIVECTSYLLSRVKGKVIAFAKRIKYVFSKWLPEAICSLPLMDINHLTRIRAALEEDHMKFHFPVCPS